MDWSTLGSRPVAETHLPAVDAIGPAVEPHPWLAMQAAASLKAGEPPGAATPAGAGTADCLSLEAR